VAPSANEAQPYSAVWLGLNLFHRQLTINQHQPDGLLTRRHCPFEARVPPRPDGNDSMEGPVPPGPRDAVERIPPCPPSASEVAKRLECASLLALSQAGLQARAAPVR